VAAGWDTLARGEMALERLNTGAEDWIRIAVQWLRLGVETVGALIVGMGVILSVALFVQAVMRRQTADCNAIRLTLARYLALALEFQLGADILSTAVAPSWTQIGKLGAIAIIRTTLNFFLSREMQDERKSERTDTKTKIA